MSDVRIKLVPAPEHGGYLMAISGTSRNGIKSLDKEYSLQESEFNSGSIKDSLELPLLLDGAGEKLATSNSDQLSLIKAAYWDGIRTQDHDIISISNALREATGKEVGAKGAKVVFNMFSYQVIGAGIQWGFNDQRVIDDMSHFILQNKSEILNKLKENGF